jgi:hypothetical protein
MSFSELFKVFSKRADFQLPDPKPVSESFRNRVFMRCRDVFDGSTFWDEIHSKLAYLHGRPRLANVETNSRAMDALAFLHYCEDAHFLDFLECIFQTQATFQASGQANLVEDFNEFLRQDDLPYAVTDFVWTERQDGPYLTRTLTARPQVIRKDSEVVFSQAIQPALYLLREPDFEAANKEFLEALEDYRKNDFDDCLTKCGSAFESVLKVICYRENWPHKSTDTSAALLKTVLERSGLEPFFEQPLILVATIRNRLSTSHGAGLTHRNVTEAKAEYAVNATAAAILLLTKERR